MRYSPGKGIESLSLDMADNCDKMLSLQED